MPLTIITLRKGDEMHTGSVLNKYRKYDYEQATHCMVCDLADSKRKNEDLLYRRLDDTQDCLYIQSKTPLDPHRVSDMGYDAQIVDIDSLLHALSCGDTVKILAKLAPTICVNGNRLPTITDDEIVGAVLDFHQLKLVAFVQKFLHHF